MYYITFNNNNKLITFTLEDWNNLPFYNIKFLIFSCNQLIKLPNLDKLINLQQLYCGNNQLT